MNVYVAGDFSIVLCLSSWGMWAGEWVVPWLCQVRVCTWWYVHLHSVGLCSQLAALGKNAGSEAM